MRAFLAILLLSVTVRALAFGILGNSSQPFTLLQSGLGGPAAFGDGNKILVGTTASDGTFDAQPVNASDYLNSVVYSLDPGGFATVGGVVYNKGSLNGGQYPSLNTNLTGIFSSFSFLTNSRIIIGAVPSFKSSLLTGNFSGATGLTPPTGSVTVQISTDGGNTWNNSGGVTVPCLVSLYDSGAEADGATNLTVYSYVNPTVVGQTNDLTSQTLLVTSSTDPRSVCSVATAATSAAAAVPLWANSPAVNNVNLSGHSLIMSGDWTFNTVTESTLNLTGDGNIIASFNPGVVSGSKCVFQNLTKTGTNLTFQLSSPSTPTIQYETNLSASAWATLPSQSNWFAGGYYFVSAPALASVTNCFFRGSTVGSNSVPATVTIHAQLKADAIIFTNAAGSRFSLTVNTATNGFVFTPMP